MALSDLIGISRISPVTMFVLAMNHGYEFTSSALQASLLGMLEVRSRIS